MNLKFFMAVLLALAFTTMANQHASAQCGTNGYYAGNGYYYGAPPPPPPPPGYCAPVAYCAPRRVYYGRPYYGRPRYYSAYRNRPSGYCRPRYRRCR